MNKYNTKQLLNFLCFLLILFVFSIVSFHTGHGNIAMREPGQGGKMGTRPAHNRHRMQPTTQVHYFIVYYSSLNCIGCVPHISFAVSDVNYISHFIFFYFSFLIDDEPRSIADPGTLHLLYSIPLLLILCVGHVTLLVHFSLPSAVQ